MDSDVGDPFENIEFTEVLPFIPMGKFITAYKDDFKAPLMPMLISAYKPGEESSEVTESTVSEEQSTSASKSNDKKPFRINLYMAVAPFLLVLLIYLVISHFKER